MDRTVINNSSVSRREKKQLFRYRQWRKSQSLASSSVQNGDDSIVTANSNNVQPEIDLITSAENNASKKDGNENNVIKIVNLADIEPYRERRKI